MSPSPLRNIPSVNELLENPRIKGLVDRISHNVVVNSVRTVLDEVGHEVQTATAERSMPSMTELAERIARRILEGQPTALRPVINATGVVVPGGLGRAPLSDEAVAAMVAVAGDYASVELDLASGKHRRRTHVVESRLRELTDAEAALVVNNTAGALMAALAALAAGREVVVARSQMIEMGCSYRLPNVMAAAGVVPHEVGTVNKTYLSDYAEAIGPSTAALLLVRPTNSEVVGATGDVPPEEVIELAHKHKVPVVQCLGYGALIDLSAMGLPGEPVISRCVSAGADLVLFSGDKLVGGPQCGIIVGRRSPIERIQGHPLARALRVDPPTLAALAATLEAYDDPEKARQKVPLLGLLAASVDNLKNRAERLAPQLQATQAVRSAEVIEGTTTLAGNAVAAQELPTVTVSIEPDGMTAEKLAGLLRQGSPPLIVRTEGDRLAIDLRSVFPRHDARIVELVEAISPRPADEEAAEG